MKQLYDFRKTNDVKLTGLETLEVVISNQMVDKAEHNKALEEIISQLPSRYLNRETGVRVMMIGSEDDDTEFFKMVESLNATIVTDEHCTGTRYFWNEVVPQDDRLMALSARYIDRPPCPSKDWEERMRIPHILKLAKDFNVEGAIIIQQKFCDPHELDIPAIKKALEDVGIPTLFLEFDVTVPLGQFKIRCEAFFEMFMEEDLF